MAIWWTLQIACSQGLKVIVLLRMVFCWNLQIAHSQGEVAICPESGVFNLLATFEMSPENGFLEELDLVLS